MCAYPPLPPALHHDAAADGARKLDYTDAAKAGCSALSRALPFSLLNPHIIEFALEGKKSAMLAKQRCIM